MSKFKFFVLMLLKLVIVTSFAAQNPKSKIRIKNNLVVNNKEYKAVYEPGKIPQHVLKLALTAYKNAENKNLVEKSKLTIIDYSLPSDQKRLWILDMENNHVDVHTYVSHGAGSGTRKTAVDFSNDSKSHKSSIGVMKTGSIYHGHNGPSMYLHGLEKDINDNVYPRRIVVHGAHYVSELHAKKNGSIGRSFGCPAVDYKEAKSIINKIADGSIVFVYYPNTQWLNNSAFL